VEIDPVLGVPREHGFIREPDGRFRTIDLDFDCFADTEDLGDAEPAVLVDETTMILDLNDRGQILVQATGWYLRTEVFEGETFQWVEPVWTFAVGTPGR
jgi:hypothetical protein